MKLLAALLLTAALLTACQTTESPRGDVAESSGPAATVPAPPNFNRPIGGEVGRPAGFVGGGSGTGSPSFGAGPR